MSNVLEGLLVPKTDYGRTDKLHRPVINKTIN